MFQRQQKSSCKSQKLVCGQITEWARRPGPIQEVTGNFLLDAKQPKTDRKRYKKVKKRQKNTNNPEYETEAIPKRC